MDTQGTETAGKKSFGEILLSLPKWVLYLMLFICTSVPLFIGKPVPNQPTDSSIDLFVNMAELPNWSTILIGSDWTNSTKGESGGEFEAAMRILMRKNIKFAIYSTGDPQAPQVAIDSIEALNRERVAAGEQPYVRFRDWVSVGYFANSEAENQLIGRDVRKAFAGRTDTEPGKAPNDIWESPVLKDIKSIKDFPMLLLFTASSTDTITIERVGGKLPIGMLVTGVMVPQEQVYYQSGQLFGLCGGIKGVYDLEWMMENGLNVSVGGKKPVVESEKYKDKIIPPMKGKNFGQGSAYIFNLHFALFLLIGAVVIGNVGMFMAKAKKAR